MNDVTRTSKELVRPLTDRLISACVAGCSCLTKTPDIQYHEPLCHYRLHMEAVHALNGLTAVYETFGIGVAVRTPSTLLENVKNAFRRSNCLSAIEREFFTKVVKDDDGEDIDECPLNWGSDPKQYVEQFRAALAAYSAHEPPAEQLPSAWIKGHTLHTDAGIEYDEEVVPGSDRPKGDGWHPLYSRPSQPPGVIQLEGECPSCRQWVVLRTDTDEAHVLPAIRCACGAHEWPPNSVQIEDSRGRLHTLRGCQPGATSTKPDEQS